MGQNRLARQSGSAEAATAVDNGFYWGWALHTRRAMQNSRLTLRPRQSGWRLGLAAGVASSTERNHDRERKVAAIEALRERGPEKPRDV